MSTSSPRAHVVSRAHSAESWDAGVHAESELGAIDVGIAVDEQSLGLVVDAPQLGRIRLALDVDDRGVTRLSALSRQLADGRDAPTEALTDEAHDADEAGGREQDERLEAHARERERLEARALELEQRVAEQQGERQRLEARLTALEAEAQIRSDELQRSIDDAATELQREESAHREARAEIERLEAERATLRARLAEAAAAVDQLRLDLDEARATASQLSAQLEDARGAQAQLEEQLRARDGDDGVAARAGALERALAEAAQRESALTDEVARLQAELATASANLTGVEAAQDARIAELERALSDAELELGRLRGVEASLADLREVAGRAAALEISMTELQDTAGRAAALERSLAEAQQARDELAAQLDQSRTELAVTSQQLGESQEVIQAWQSALATEQAATAEAREVARQLKAQADALIAERDEARGIARQLHQRLATGADPASKESLAKLSGERDRLALQVESLERQLEGERSARARAMADRDALKARIDLETNREVTEAPTVERPAFYRGQKP